MTFSTMCKGCDFERYFWVQSVYFTFFDRHPIQLIIDKIYKSMLQFFNSLSNENACLCEGGVCDERPANGGYMAAENTITNYGWTRTHLFFLTSIFTPLDNSSYR